MCDTINFLDRLMRFRKNIFTVTYRQSTHVLWSGRSLPGKLNQKYSARENGNQGKPIFCCQRLPFGAVKFHLHLLVNFIPKGTGKYASGVG